MPDEILLAPGLQAARLLRLWRLATAALIAATVADTVGRLAGTGAGTVLPTIVLDGAAMGAWIVAIRLFLWRGRLRAAHYTMAVGILGLAVFLAATSPADESLLVLPVAAAAAVLPALRRREMALFFAVVVSATGLIAVLCVAKVTTTAVVDPAVVILEIALIDAVAIYLLWDAASAIRTALGQAAESARRRAASQAALERQLDERAHLSAAMSRLAGGVGWQDPGTAICAEAAALPGVDSATIIALLPDAVVPVALAGARDARWVVGHPLPGDLGSWMAARAAEGLWLDGRRPGDLPDWVRRALDAVGLSGCALMPLVHESRTVGLLGVATHDPLEAGQLRERLPAVVELAAVASALVGPGLDYQRQRTEQRAILARIARNIEFHPVFHAILDTWTHRVVGYEALTRFDDGARPDVRFAHAEEAGIGPELEAAAIAAAIRDMDRLPAGAWVSVNASAELLARDMLPTLIGMTDRAIVVEVTEHTAVTDYKALRASVACCPPGTRVAIDDAGAGYAGLQHILALEPAIVKLDLQLIRGIDTDPARQALVAGMVHFSRAVGCELIGEGVETAAEHRALAELGVQMVQGFLFGRPQPIDQIAPARAA